MSRPDSIRVQSLRTYLNTTVGEHRGKGYVSFVQMVDDGASNSYIARAFGVHRNTVFRWLKLYHEENHPAAQH